MDITDQIKPFAWIAHDDGNAAVTLYASEKYKKELFKTRKKERFSGNGYDWEALAQVFIQEKMPDIWQELDFDSEAGMFCVRSSNKNVLRRFAVSFKEACENGVLIRDLFSRAEPQKPVTSEDIDNVFKRLGIK